MAHIELVNRKSIIVKETIHELASMKKPTVRLTMITSKRVWNPEVRCFLTELKEQEIFLHKDMIVYFYEKEIAQADPKTSSTKT